MNRLMSTYVRGAASGLPRRAQHAARLTGCTPLRRDYNFASSAYVATFGDFPPVDVAKLRADTVAAIESFDPNSWHAEPLKTHVAGKAYAEGELLQTTDAFEVVNGKQIVATPAVLDAGARTRNQCRRR